MTCVLGVGLRQSDVYQNHKPAYIMEVTFAIEILQILIYVESSL